MGEIYVREVRSELNAELLAIQKFAPFVEATSRKGAIFQALVVGSEARAPIGITNGSLPNVISHNLSKHCQRQERAWLSILSVIDEPDDTDLAMVRCWLLSPGEMRELIGRTVLDELDRLRVA